MAEDAVASVQATAYLPHPTGSRRRWGEAHAIRGVCPPSARMGTVSFYEDYRPPTKTAVYPIRRRPSPSSPFFVLRAAVFVELSFDAAMRYTGPRATNEHRGVDVASTMSTQHTDCRPTHLSDIVSPRALTRRDTPPATCLRSASTYLTLWGASTIYIPG
ncbi:uncharacterized protein SCHCODRAFT_02252370 [Schizophyllum commune H4-8]|uniref:uncharacterized protein n=1 Tax=Schizophyllum commune (strain H4-8 / FGSC 9210) TaxID=578458 RepID=UPI00215DEF86|nr:uncharacterized protein SCHCODRAFT_02252370 [Schizophyllum commune H4-8]KAI5893392.1 hypothetical protein SCHCODRAFT_02252370 [Schizophyllum commune H4-8]